MGFPSQFIQMINGVRRIVLAGSLPLSWRERYQIAKMKKTRVSPDETGVSHRILTAGRLLPVIDLDGVGNFCKKSSPPHRPFTTNPFLRPSRPLRFPVHNQETPMKVTRRLTLGLCCLSFVGCAQFQLAEWMPETEYNPLEYYKEGPLHADRYDAELIAVQRFVDAVELERLDLVRATCSRRFGERALSHPDSFADLDVISLPVGEVEVLKLDNVSETEKRVQAAVGEHKQKLTFALQFDADEKEWLVDDIFMRQKKDGVIARRSVSDQMQLLVTVRNFMEAAQNEDRPALLANTTPDFQHILAELPDQAFERIRARIAGEKPMRSLTPDAQLSEDKAIVKIHRLSGQLLMTLVIDDGAWKINDLAVESREDQYHIPSLRHTASVIKTGVDFLKAYQAGDRQGLEAVSEPRFYRYNLSDADLTSFPLPVDEMLKSEYRIKAQGRVATIVVPVGDDVVTLDLERDEFSDETEDSEEYRVRELTYFSAQNDQKRQLSSVFTSQSTLKAFAKALSERNLQVIQRLATPDFNRLVWDRLDEQSVKTLPIEGWQGGPYRIIRANYQGKLTEFAVQHGEYVVTYQIRDWNGEQLVDDILVRIPDRPKSLKNTLALVIPVHKFVEGIASDDLVQIQRSVSRDYNRLVWKHLAGVPAVAKNSLRFCLQPLGEVQMRGEEADVHLNGATLGAEVNLVREDEQWVVDEVHLLSHDRQMETAELKQTMRMQVADGTIHDNFLPDRRPQFAERTAATDTGVRQIGYEVPAGNGSPSGAAPPAELSEDAMQLDELPRVQVPAAEPQPSAPAGASAEPATEPIRAYGKLPHQRKKRLNPMAPIWKQ